MALKSSGKLRDPKVLNLLKVCPKESPEDIEYQFICLQYHAIS